MQHTQPEAGRAAPPVDLAPPVDSAPPVDLAPAADVGAKVSPDSDAGRAAQLAVRLRAEIGRVIVGQEELVELVLIGLLAEGHVLLEGVPGLGKTKLLTTLASALDLEMARIQFTPDLMPADIVGTQVIEETADKQRSFRFRPGPIVANLVLADEVNRATPKTQAAMLEAMQERAVTSGGETRPLPRPFFVMATQNPIEQDGTYPLPEAQLDRFLLKAIVSMPSADELVQIVERTTVDVEAVPERVTDGASLRDLIALTREVPIASHLVRHAVDLVVASHPDSPQAPQSVRDYVRTGVSPRGAQALVLAGKARALLSGRPNVAAEDIRALAPAALRHRVLLGYEALADKVTSDMVVADVLGAVPPPGSGVRGAP